MPIIRFTQRDGLVQRVAHELLSIAKYDLLPGGELYEERAWRNKKIKKLQGKSEAVGIHWPDLYREAVILADTYRE